MTRVAPVARTRVRPLGSRPLGCLAPVDSSGHYVGHYALSSKGCSLNVEMIGD